MKFREKWTEQNNGGNANCKYSIKGFKRHLTGAVPVAGVIYFVLLLRWFFFNKCWTKMKLKVGLKLMELKNCGMLIVNTSSEASMDTYPLMLLLFSFLCYCCINFLKIIAIRKWNWRLAVNGEKNPTEVLIVNTPPGYQIEMTLWCCCCCCTFFCAVAADIIWI